MINISTEGQRFCFRPDVSSLIQALNWGEKEKIIGERSELRVNLGRGKGGGAWRHAFDAVDPPSSN